MDIEPKFFYTNSAELTFSPFDFSLRFNRVAAGPPSAPEVSFRPVVASVSTVESVVVSMSPSHCKALLPGLVELVRKYEQDIGTIPIPPEAQVAWDRVFNAGKH